MSRVKRGLQSHKTHKALLKRTKGYRGTRNNLIRQARQALLNAGIFAYRDRRNKKRDLRREWISTINIALHASGYQYHEFMHEITKLDQPLNRKVLANMAETDPAAFKYLATAVMKKKTTPKD